MNPVSTFWRVSSSSFSMFVLKIRIEVYMVVLWGCVAFGFALQG